VNKNTASDLQKVSIPMGYMRLLYEKGPKVLTRILLGGEEVASGWQKVAIP
jgi:hypothetical protein